MEIKKDITVTITPKDFLSAKFSIEECSLALALKRQGYKEVAVNIDNIYVFNDNGVDVYLLSERDLGLIQFKSGKTNQSAMTVRLKPLYN